jgi:hypothetical protein
MQMYAVVATGVLGLLIGFWLGRSIRWNMEETEEAVNRQEERKITGNRQLVMEGTAIGSPVNGEIRKISQDTLQDTTEAGTEKYERFQSGIGRRKRTLVQYDYRHTDGELFACVKPTLDECRTARNKWLNAKQGKEDNR